MATFTKLTVDGSVSEKLGTGTVGNNIIIVDLATGNFFEVDMQNSNANISTFTISNASGTHISSFVLKINQGNPARQLALGGSFKWVGGVAPVLTTTENAVDILSFTTYDYGTTWHGIVVGQNYS